MMGPFLNSLLIYVSTILLSITIAIIAYFKWTFTYWKRKNVPYLEPSIPFGTTENPFDRKDYLGHTYKKQYDKLKAMGYKYAGLYIILRPVYAIIDPDLVRNIMATDFRHFTDHGTYFNEKDDPLSAHLFSLEGEKWRNLRAKLTPTFTSSKMRMMIQTLVDCSKQMKVAVDEMCMKKEPVDIKKITGCFIMDVVGSCALGLNCNSFLDPKSEFRTYSMKLFEPVTKLKALNNLVATSNPPLGRLLGLKLTDSEVEKFYLTFVKQTIDYREKNSVFRKDFMQILIELKNNVLSHNDEDNECEFKHDGKNLTVEELTAQVYVFLLAGFETSSTTMSCCLFELAMNPDIQQKARDEVNASLKKYNGEFSYDAMVELSYVGQVVDETLRMYPPASLIARLCVEDYKVPGEKLTIKKGEACVFPVLGFHMDPDHYPNPEKFDPDRFSEENRRKRHPFVYMPFGNGPRQCIGRRFGLLQVKAGLAVLLKHYRFSLNSRTKLPLNIDRYSYNLAILGGIWLNVEKIE